MTKKKGNKYGLLTIKEAAERFEIPEQTWRSWWRQSDNPKLQKLFRKIPGTGRIFVHEETVVAEIELDLMERLELAEMY